MPLLSCHKHVVYDEECQRCHHVQIMNSLNRIDEKLSIALAVFATIEKKRMEETVKDG